MNKKIMKSISVVIELEVNYLSNGGLSLWSFKHRDWLFSIFKESFSSEYFSKKVIEEVDNVIIFRNKNVQLLSNVSLQNEMLTQGRFLSYNPHNTMFDEIISDITNGFFDGCDMPPPEFWLGMKDDHLLSFIPEKYLDVVQLGIDNSLGEALEWINLKIDKLD